MKRATFLLALACLALLVPACLATTARIAAGPSVDTDGEVGYEVTVSAGLGIATSKKSAVWTSV